MHTDDLIDALNEAEARYAEARAAYYALDYGNGMTSEEVEREDERLLAVMEARHAEVERLEEDLEDRRRYSRGLAPWIDTRAHI